MIKVTRLNGTETVINAELIESVEGTPDTVISLTTGHKYVVQESVDEVVARVLAYRKACCRSEGSPQPAQEANPTG